MRLALMTILVAFFTLTCAGNSNGIRAVDSYSVENNKSDASDIMNSVCGCER